MTTAHTTRTHSSLERAAHIALVLAQHELWYLIDVLNLERFVPVHLHRSTTSHQKSPELRTQPEQLRSAYRPGVPGVWDVVLTIGLTLAGVLALYLVWSIFRSGHH
jgi:hypothetical protein